MFQSETLWPWNRIRREIPRVSEVLLSHHDGKFPVGFSTLDTAASLSWRCLEEVTSSRLGSTFTSPFSLCSSTVDTHAVVLQLLLPLHLVTLVVLHQSLHEVFGSRPAGVLAAGVRQGSLRGGGRDGWCRSNLLDLSCKITEEIR